METWYEVSCGRITEHEVLKVTDKMLELNLQTYGYKNRWIMRKSWYSTCFPNKKEAIEYLMADLRKDIEVAQERLALAKASLSRP